MGARSPTFVCAVCGTYRLAERTAQQLYEETGAAFGGMNLYPNHHLLSAVLRERFDAAGDTVPVDSMRELLAAARPLPGGYLESVDRLLISLDSRITRLGTPVRFVETYDYPLAWAQDGAEFKAVVNLAQEIGLLTITSQMGDELRLTLQPMGWRRLQELRLKRVEHRQAFVAMWFSPDMTDVFTSGMAPALGECGYRPLRIDRLEHNDKVDDRIVAAIRQSGLVVADFTGGRGGVYFEAGLAMGRGIPVIWTCRQDYFEQHGVHFDTRQYNHIVWADPRDLAERLEARIRATLPTFPPT
jgi:nucleoside 2-deoxyribosyltransferase